MKVNVIIPSYNRPEWTIRAIQSVAMQTYSNWHLILVDDGSSDNTYERACDYLKSCDGISYTTVKTPNLGVSHARNIGIKLSSSPLISFLDCDDWWFPHKLEAQVNFLNNNPHLKWVYTEELWLKNDQPFLRKKQHQKFDTNIFENCVNRCFIGVSSVMIMREIFNTIGFFNEDYPVCEDYELWLRISNKYPIGFLSEEHIVKNGGHDDQLSTKYKAMDYWRVKASASMLNKGLSENQTQAIKTFINKKAPILINGFNKYNHPKKAQEILRIKSLIEAKTL